MDVKRNHIYIAKIKVVCLESSNYHIFVQGRWNKKPINLCVDTGASQTCMDIDYFRQHSMQEVKDIDAMMKVGVSPSDFDARVSTLEHFSIGKCAIQPFLVGLLNISHINEAYKKMKVPKIHGILGSDFFVRYQVVIDYQNQQLVINKN